MPIITGPFHVVAGLLLVAGAAKLVRPGPTAAVVQAAGLLASRVLVRAFAAVEVAAAVAAFAVGGVMAAGAVSVMYLAFAGFVLMLKMRGIETAGCGCFGQKAEDPPGSLHVAVDGIAAVIALAAAIAHVPAVAAVLAEQPLAGVPYVGFVVLGVWLLVVMLTDLPRLAHLTQEATR